MEEKSLPFGTRVWFAWAVLLRVLFDGVFASRVWDTQENPRGLPAGPGAKKQLKRLERSLADVQTKADAADARATDAEKARDAAKKELAKKKREADEAKAALTEELATALKKLEEAEKAAAARIENASTAPVESTKPSKKKREPPPPAKPADELTSSALDVPEIIAGPEKTTAYALSFAKPAPRGPRDIDAALQLLALFQREGRLIDFLEQDIAGFPDADIGAATRVVHEGCRKALRDHAKIKAVRSEEEETAVVVQAGFSPAEIKLTGNVAGKPPYRGVLKHKGWRAEGLQLPEAAATHDATILAPAEVEI